MAETLTAQEAASRLVKLGKRMKQAPALAMRRVLNTVRTKSYVRFASQGGIGARIWTKGGTGKGLKSYRTMVARSRVDFKGESVMGGLRAIGIPAMVEQGGRIEPHVIRRGFGREGNPIRHPGGLVARRPFLEPTLNASLPEIGAAITGSYDYEIAKVKLDG